MSLTSKTLQHLTAECCAQVRGILSGAQEELRRLDERQTANFDAASSLADLTQQHDDLKVCLLMSPRHSQSAGTKHDDSIRALKWALALALAHSVTCTRNLVKPDSRDACPQKELQDAATLAETKLNVSQAHAAAAIAQNEQLAQAATEAVQQLDEASQTIQNLGTRAEQQAEEHQLRISEVSHAHKCHMACELQHVCCAPRCSWGALLGRQLSVLQCCLCLCTEPHMHWTHPC